MSVLLPWTRKQKSKDGRGAPAHRSLPARPRPRSRAVRLLVILAGLAAALLTVHEAYLDGTLPRPLPGGSKVWETSRLDCFEGLYALGDEPEGRAFYGPRGKIASLSRPPVQAAISGGRLYTMEGTSIYVYGPDGALSAAGTAGEGERLLPCSDLEGILMVKPASGGFGEQWVLRVITTGGEVFRPVHLPGIPVKAAQQGKLLYLGLRDVAAGGLSRLACADPTSGTLLWSLPLDQGHWRSVIPSPAGKTAYATSQGAGLVGPDGGLLCSFPVRGSVSAIVWENQSVIICHGSPAQPLVTVLSEAGQVIWEHPVPSPAHSLIYGESIVVALCQTHVVGFSLRDGHREFSFTTRDLPLALGDGLVLLGKDSGACLVDLDTNLTRLP